MKVSKTHHVTKDGIVKKNPAKSVKSIGIYKLVKPQKGDIVNWLALQGEAQVFVAISQSQKGFVVEYEFEMAMADGEAVFSDFGDAYDFAKVFMNGAQDIGDASDIDDDDGNAGDQYYELVEEPWDDALNRFKDKIISK